MIATHTTDPCGADSACLIPPAEFVRLRYFFGQHLGVVDLADEQSYLVGKQRFHNLRAHGVGVLCGLRAARYVFPQGSPPPGPMTTLLRVRRGAALDGCGREIIVGWDQCIDVAAWFAQHPAAAASVAGGTLRLWVALRYRECPSDPAPAPRDPCGCDPGGCEFARIREGFELSLLLDAEAKECAATVKDPGSAALIAEETLGGPLDSAYRHRAALIAGADCPEPAADTCLLLASFEAKLDSTGKKVVDITLPDNAIPERRSLLATAVLQEALLRMLAAAGDAEFTGSGPGLGTATFQNGGADSGTLSITILADGGANLSQDPIAAAQLTLNVSRFKDDGTWEAAPAFTSTYVAGPPSRIDIAWANGLIDGGRYRAVIESNRTQPPVDTKMRPLTPPFWARHFRLTTTPTSGGKLVLADSLYT